MYVHTYIYIFIHKHVYLPWQTWMVNISEQVRGVLTPSLVAWPGYVESSRLVHNKVRDSFTISNLFDQRPNHDMCIAQRIYEYLHNIYITGKTIQILWREWQLDKKVKEQHRKTSLDTETQRWALSRVRKYLWSSLEHEAERPGGLTCAQSLWNHSIHISANQRSTLMTGKNWCNSKDRRPQPPQKAFRKLRQVQAFTSLIRKNRSRRSFVDLVHAWQGASQTLVSIERSTPRENQKRKNREEQSFKFAQAPSQKL